MEATMKHTPGPWRIFPPEHMCTVTAEGEMSDVVICRTWSPDHVASYVGFTRDECLANAHLIAAAPDLLAALERLHAIASEALALAGHATTPDGCPRKCQPSSYPGGCQGIGPMA